MNTNKRKKLVTIFDLISLFFGICGTCLGILSILALKTSWAKHTSDDGALNSFVVTCVTLGVDIFSCLAAFISFILGRAIYREISLVDIDPIRAKLAKHEKNSYEFDKTSFIIGVFGLCFGTVSLLTIKPWDLQTVSVSVTIVAIVLDFASSLMIVFALSQMAKYENVKDIATLARDTIALEHEKWN